jgi:hypothetical protein
MHPHNPGSYLGDLGEAFTWISKRVLREGIESIISNNPAEILHHMERRLSAPERILDATNLAPVTGREHNLIHTGKILLGSTPEGKIAIVDFWGAHFMANPLHFRELWNYWLWKWQESAPR